MEVFFPLVISLTNGKLIDSLTNSKKSLFQVAGIPPMMRPPALSGNVMLFLLILFAQELMGKRNKERHNREANKKLVPANKCVADYCLPLEYNPLELPSSERQDVQINLEVSTSFSQCN